MGMMPVSDTVGAANPTMGRNTDYASKSLAQKDFLTLMIAQIKNQDPMEAKTNGDFLAQMAQFSTSDGITKMQETIQQLASSLSSTQALQATSLVGKKVLVPSDKMNLGAEDSPTFGLNIPPGADVSVTASIYSENNELIRTISLGKPAEGFSSYTWDGKNSSGERVPEGKYRIEVRGSMGGKEYGINTLMASNVDSISMLPGGQGVLVNVAGIGPMSLSDIRQIIG